MKAIRKILLTVFAVAIGMAVSLADADVRVFAISKLNSVVTFAVNTAIRAVSDSVRIDLCGGSGCGVTHGATISIGGNSATNYTGRIYLTPGFVANTGILAGVQDSSNIPTSAGFQWFDANYTSTISRKVKAALTGTLSGATGTLTNFIPAGTFVYGVVCRVTTTITGATTWTLGDGSTADLWATGIALASGTTTSSTNFKSTWTPKFYSAANNVVVTATGSNFTGGNIRCAVWYDDMSGPTG